MPPIDNSQFTEEQRTEAYRLETIGLMQRQTRALESIRSILVFFLVVFLIGLAVSLSLMGHVGGL